MYMVWIVKIVKKINAIKLVWVLVQAGRGPVGCPMGNDRLIISTRSHSSTIWWVDVANEVYQNYDVDREMIYTVDDTGLSLRLTAKTTHQKGCPKSLNFATVSRRRNVEEGIVIYCLQTERDRTSWKIGWHQEERSNDTLLCFQRRQWRQHSVKGNGIRVSHSYLPRRWGNDR